MTNDLHPLIRPFMTLDRDRLDFQLSPSRSAKDATGSLEGMVTATERARQSAALTLESDVRYAPGANKKLDLYLPQGSRDVPLLVFVHGGFWQEGSKDVSGFAAEALGARGWATCGLGYPLAPGATLTEICTAVHEALSYLIDHAKQLGVDADRIVLAGHSAGAHLVACLLAGLPTSRPYIADAIAGAILISGVYELAPIARSYVNDLVAMSPAEERALSPLRYSPRADVPVHLLVGQDEPEAFRAQTEALKAQWSEHLSEMTVCAATGRDHFDILQELCDPATATSRALAQMGGQVGR